jgi:hypothetical protein
MTRLFGPVVLAVLLLAIPQPASAALISFLTRLDGLSESPPNASPGTGVAQVDWDDVANTMRVRVTFSGLEAGTTASHIHSATAVPGTGNAGVATQVPSFTGFPLGVTSGSYDNTFDMTLATSYNPAFVTANGGTVASAQAALFAGLTSGRAYLNIHTSNFPGGEIRGFLQATPEPSTLWLLGPALLGLIAHRRRRAARESSK